MYKNAKRKSTSFEACNQQPTNLSINLSINKMSTATTTTNIAMNPHVTITTNAIHSHSTKSKAGKPACKEYCEHCRINTVTPRLKNYPFCKRCFDQDELDLKTPETLRWMMYWYRRLIARNFKLTKFERTAYTFGYNVPKIFFKYDTHYTIIELDDYDAEPEETRYGNILKMLKDKPVVLIRFNTNAIAGRENCFRLLENNYAVPRLGEFDARFMLLKDFLNKNLSNVPTVPFTEFKLYYD